MPENWLKIFGWKMIQNCTEGGLWLLLVFQSWGISPGFGLSCRAGWSTDAWVGLSKYKLMTCVLCSYCRLSFRLKGWYAELGRWSCWSCRVPTCLYEGDLCQLSSPLDNFAAWVDVGTLWLLSKLRCSLEDWHSLLCSAGETCLPQVPSAAGSEGAVRMGAYS